MPFRRRHNGLTVLERFAEIKLWKNIMSMLQTENYTTSWTLQVTVVLGMSECVSIC